MKLIRAILATLTYSDHFHYPLSLPELHSRLIFVHTSRPQLTRTLSSLLHTHRLGFTNGYYHLPSRTDLVARRLRAHRISAPLLLQARDLATHLGHFPNVLAIYLTGSLAVENTTPTSDIDFMVITSPHRLWTTRLLLTLYTSLRGWRRTPHSHQSLGKLCLNLYLTPTSYLLPTTKRSLYTAYELVQAVPLYDPSHTHPQLLAANPWILSYLPNYPMPSRSDLLRRRPQRVFSRALARPGQTFLEFLEFVCYHCQYLYMKPKITREYITHDAAFFHPRDPSKSVLKKLSL